MYHNTDEYMAGVWGQQKERIRKKSNSQPGSSPNVSRLLTVGIRRSIQIEARHRNFFSWMGTVLLEWSVTVRSRVSKLHVVNPANEVKLHRSLKKNKDLADHGASMGGSKEGSIWRGSQLLYLAWPTVSYFDVLSNWCVYECGVIELTGGWWQQQLKGTIFQDGLAAFVFVSFWFFHGFNCTLFPCISPSHPLGNCNKASSGQRSGEHIPFYVLSHLIGLTSHTYTLVFGSLRQRHR